MNTLETRHAALLLTMLWLIPAAIGCGGDDAKPDEGVEDAKKKDADLPTRARHKNLSRDGFAVQTRDLNKDERPDQWYLSATGGVLARIERDLNFDGRVDVWQYPDASGVILEEEMDLDHDGRVDVVARYRADGSIESKELALEFDDVFTVFKYYDAGGALLRVEHDEDGDETIDRLDYYEEGRIVRTGWDDNGDGVPDKFDNLGD